MKKEPPGLSKGSAVLFVADMKLLHDLHDEPWGQRTIRFFDPDDHLIEAGESLKLNSDD